MSKAPEICFYCDGEGNSSAGGRCGFCENGKPLDTQEDWDQSWGKVGEASLKFLLAMREEIILSEADQDRIAELLNRKKDNER